VFDYLESEMGHLDRNYREIEIIHNEFKKPVIRLISGISECVRRLNIREILISISHSRNWISGMVIFCY
jgi:phosphopantetheinyl transferase (holo-ACP synthase)